MSELRAGAVVKILHSGRAGILLTNGEKSGGTHWYQVLTSDGDFSYHCKANLGLFLIAGEDTADVWKVRYDLGEGSTWKLQKILRDLENDIAKYKWENGLV